VKIGAYLSLYATGEGGMAVFDPPVQTGIHPVLPVSVTVGGMAAPAQYAGPPGAGLLNGVMQVNAQIPVGVQPGSYVPVILSVGERSSSSDVWIAIGP